MRIPRYPVLTLKETKGEVRGGFPLEPTLLLSRGSDAISVLAENGILTEDTPALIPSYTCASLIDPLLRRRIPLLYYSVTDQFSVNPQEIDSQAGRQAKVLFIIHYFGVIQKMEEIRKFCSEREILLIEDCAHSFLSEYKGSPVGTWGDVSFFSLRKTVPVPNGGMLKINNSRYKLKSENLKHTARMRDLKWILKNVITYFEFKTGITIRKKPSRGKMSENSTESIHNGVQGISKLTTILLSRFNFQEIRKRRFENFNYLAKALKDIERISLPFGELTEGSSPMALPAVLKESSNRRFCLAMNRAGIDVYPWPWLSEEMCKLKTDPTLRAIDLSEKLVLFPIHQNLNQKHLDYIAAHASALLK